MDNYSFVDTFRNRLEKAMALRDMTAADLSKKSGLSDALISGYRTGRQEPKREKLAMLAKALSVSPGWLMGFDTPMIDATFQHLAAHTGAEKYKEAQKEFAREYLTKDATEVVIAYHDADQTVKNMIRKMLDLLPLEEKRESLDA